MTAPTRASGYVDDNIVLTGGTSQLVDMALEASPDLWWPQSVRQYARMRHDPQLAAVLKAYGYPIRRATWAVDGSNCRPEVTQLIADEVGLPILGQDEIPSGRKRRRFQWGTHLRLSLLDLTFGHMAFERIYDTTGDLTRLAGVYERMPQTIQEIKLDGTDGTITSIKQQYAASESRGIAAPALVWYAHEREGANWVGQSLLRPAWAFWLLKHETARVHAISIRRFGTGILEVQAPPGATPGQIAEAQQYASQIRVSEQGGAGLPAGFTSSLRGMVGSVPDAVAFMNYLDQQMTRATLTSLLDLGGTPNGSRALGETFMDLFLLALQSIADEHAEQATEQLAVPLVDWNWGEDEPAPRIVCGDVGAQHEVTAQTLQLLLSSGALSADPALEEFLRREYKLPDRATAWTPPGGPALPDPMAAMPDEATSAEVAASFDVHQKRDLLGKWSKEGGGGGGTFDHKDIGALLEKKYPGSQVDISTSARSNKITLHKIVLPEGDRGKGTGSKMMQDLIDYADAGEGVRIELTPDTTYGGTSVARLTAFYKKFGFVENKGRNKNYEVSESMYRPAKGA